MLAVQPEFSGRLRVLLSNLGKGIDSDVAYKNAFEKTSEQIEQALNKYIEAGQYGTIAVSGKPVNAQRQFIPKEVDDKTGALAMADVAYANGSDPGYEKLNDIEGQGLLALTKREIARKLEHCSRKVQGRIPWSNTQSFCLPPKVSALLKKPPLPIRAGLSPTSSGCHGNASRTEAGRPAKSDATRSERCDSWIQLAQTQESAKQMAEAAKSWAAAERATDDPAERDRVHQYRAAGERARSEAEMAERDEVRRKAEQECRT